MAITAGITHRLVSQAGLLHQPDRQEELRRQPDRLAGLPHRPVLPAGRPHQPGSQAEPLLQHALQHHHRTSHRHQPGLLPHPGQIILPDLHPDRWDHLLTEAVLREAEVTAEAAELPEVVAAVAGDADLLYC